MPQSPNAWSSGEEELSSPVPSSPPPYVSPKKHSATTKSSYSTRRIDSPSTTNTSDDQTDESRKRRSSEYGDLSTSRFQKPIIRQTLKSDGRIIDLRGAPLRGNNSTAKSKGGLWLDEKNVPLSSSQGAQIVRTETVSDNGHDYFDTTQRSPPAPQPLSTQPLDQSLPMSLQQTRPSEQTSSHLGPAPAPSLSRITSRHVRYPSAGPNSEQQAPSERSRTNRFPRSGTSISRPQTKARRGKDKEPRLKPIRSAPRSIAPKKKAGTWPPPASSSSSSSVVAVVQRGVPVGDHADGAQGAVKEKMVYPHHGLNPDKFAHAQPSGSARFARTIQRPQPQPLLPAAWSEQDVGRTIYSPRSRYFPSRVVPHLQHGVYDNPLDCFSPTHHFPHPQPGAGLLFPVPNGPNSHPLFPVSLPTLPPVRQQHAASIISNSCNVARTTPRQTTEDLLPSPNELSLRPFSYPDSGTSVPRALCRQDRTSISSLLNTEPPNGTPPQVNAVAYGRELSQSRKRKGLEVCEEEEDFGSVRLRHVLPGAGEMAALAEAEDGTGQRDGHGEGGEQREEGAEVENTDSTMVRHEEQAEPRRVRLPGIQALLGRWIE